MNACVLYKAHPATSLPEDAVPDLTIVATETVPALPDILDEYAREYEELYSAQACEIADRLQASLPGGTWDRLLAEMMKRQASLYRVRHERLARLSEQEQQE